MTSAAPPTEFFPGINFNPSFYNLGQSAVTLDYLNSNFLRSTGYAISRAQYTLFNGAVDIKQNLDVSGNVNAKAYFLNSVPVSFSQWTTSVNDIYYNTGNVGIGKTNPNSIYKLDVSGNINADKIFRAGTELTQYTDTNVRTVLSTSAGTNMTWNTGTNKFDVAAPYTDTNTRTVLSTSAGTNMTWNTGTNKFDATYTYTLPTASAANLGGVKVGNNLFIDGNGILSATSSGLTGADIFLDGGVNNRAYGWTGATSLLARVGTAGAYSLNSLAEDVILRSQGRILLQSGTNVPGLTIETTTNNIIIRNSLGIGITTFGAGDILDVGGVFKVAYNGVAESLTIRSTGINVNNTLNVSSGTNNGGIIRFGGFSDDSSLDLATIQNRQYATNKSELLLFKGDNIEGLTGADRIRLRAAAIAFDTFSTDVTTSATTENIRMYIDNTGNVGIGTTTPLSNYLLDVRGNIISTGNIALVNASTSIFWTGTSSNLARAGVAGEYSTSAAINDIVLRSGNNLILQSGTGTAGIIINTTNNVDIVNGKLLIRAFDNSIGGIKGIFFRDGFTTTNLEYNLSILAYDLDDIPNAADGLSINAFGGISFCTGSNTRFERMRINNSGNVIINQKLQVGNSAYGIVNGYMTNGSMTIGNSNQNYGGGQNWNSNTAGLLLECLDGTEIAVHDAGNAVHSFMYYSGGTFTIGRNMAWGAANVSMSNNLYVAGTSFLRNTYIYSGNEGTSIALNFATPFTGSATGASKSAIIAQAISSWSRHHLCFCLNTAADNTTNASTNDTYIRLNTGGYIEFLRETRFNTYVWHLCVSGYRRFYFSPDANGTSYYSGGNSGGANAKTTEWRRTYDDAPLGWFENTGLFRSYGYSSLSDSRIKKNIVDIDDVQALEKILLIEPKKYNYIERERNTHDVIGFIAQQIYTVIPEAITKTKGMVPNIYKNCLVNNKREIYHSIPLDVEIGTEVIITDTIDGKGGRYKILEIYNDYFVVDQDIERDEVFVKGYEINDLHNLDKNYIYTLNVCATQELYKIIMEQKNKINDLETRLSILESIIVNNRQ